MAFDPRDYAGESTERNEAERRERLEIQIQEDEAQLAREMGFIETSACELECYETLIHTIGCRRYPSLTGPLYGALSLMEQRIARAYAAIAEREAA